MKKLITPLMLCLLSYLGCETKRELTTPSNRLVGHWRTEAGTHLYFGRGDPKTKLGSYILNDASGNTYYHQYKIIGESSAGERLVVLVLFGSGEARKEEFYASKDGLSLMGVFEIDFIDTTFVDTITLKYVDNKISP